MSIKQDRALAKIKKMASLIDQDAVYTIAWEVIEESREKTLPPEDMITAIHTAKDLMDNQSLLQDVTFVTMLVATIAGRFFSRIFNSVDPSILKTMDVTSPKIMSILDSTNNLEEIVVKRIMNQYSI